MYMFHYVENIFDFLKYQLRYFEKVKTEILSLFLTRRDKLSDFFISLKSDLIFQISPKYSFLIFRESRLIQTILI